jgi:hypothetical protein
MINYYVIPAYRRLPNGKWAVSYKIFDAKETRETKTATCFVSDIGSGEEDFKVSHRWRRVYQDKRIANGFVAADLSELEHEDALILYRGEKFYLRDGALKAAAKEIL